MTLNSINVSVAQVIVVDWNAESVKMQPRNALLIPRWNGNDNDTTLIDLAAFLKSKGSQLYVMLQDIRILVQFSKKRINCKTSLS